MRIKISVAFTALMAALLFLSPTAMAADTLPRAISDDAFWIMINAFSEDGRFFPFEIMSNELQYQFVIPRLKETTKTGGVYLGVGPEQNFTYIAALQPRIAFIFDVRRQNMLQHLIYKAVFEMSSGRADFISRLFSRPVPAGLNNKSTATALFNAYAAVKLDPRLLNKNLQAIKDHLIQGHRFELSSADEISIDEVYRALSTAGAGFWEFLKPTSAYYADLMTATDRKGQNHSYLANEENFKFIQEMERNNLIVPLVGDFAGAKAIQEVGRYLKEHDATVTAFYASNVEQYLFNPAANWRVFYANVAALPLDSSSTFIRTAGPDSIPQPGLQRRYSQPPGTDFVSLLCPIQDFLDAVEKGNVRNWTQVIQMSRQ